MANKTDPATVPATVAIRLALAYRRGDEHLTLTRREISRLFAERLEGDFRSIGEAVEAAAILDIYEPERRAA